MTVHFDGTGSSDPEGGPLDYVWEFGDGVRSYDPSPTHIYETDGSYSVILGVTDEGGLDDFDLIDITVTSGVPVEPMTWGRIKALFR